MPSRPMPYDNFRFRVMWDDTYVLGASKVSGLSRDRDDGQTRYSPVVIEHGVSYDVAFERWANKVFDWATSNGPESRSGAPFDSRKDLTIEMYNEAGMKIVAYHVDRAWVSEFNARSELDRMGNALVVESMTIQNEGWKPIVP